MRQARIWTWRKTQQGKRKRCRKSEREQERERKTTVETRNKMGKKPGVGSEAEEE